MQKHLIRRLDRAAAEFDQHAFVHDATREGLLARLEPMTIAATTVLDLGAATGRTTSALSKRFRSARIVSVDVSLAMLRQHPTSLLRRPSRVQADAHRLPFGDDSIDLVFANLLLPFADDAERVIAEIARVLRSDGVFAFATLGPDSFGEIRAAWAAVDQDPHVAAFPDMHDTGDLLVRAGLRDPVLDVDRLTVTYRSPEGLFSDLSALGLRNVLPGRRRTLTGRRRLDRFGEAWFSGRETAEVSLELVFGHAFGGVPKPPRGPVRIDAASIGRRHPG